LPRLAETVDEVVISEWLVDIGEVVDVGTALLMAETDKAVVEVPSPVAGTLVEQCVANEDEVTTGTVIAVIEHA
jgi:pyruvate/2-oxoglutarate dehydrogenase complex dihydrolipoamide acyltransferase (E2) component